MAFGHHTSPSTISLSGLRESFRRFTAYLTLTPSQQRFADIFFTGSNVCLSGAAGTGKSFIIKVLFDFLSQQMMAIGKTATTGVSALNIGGQTLHSFAGLGLADEDADSLITKIKLKNSKARARIRAIDMLFIDEISMAKGDLLNKLDAVFKYFRSDIKPFGGVRLVMVGDFLQLPCIFKGDEKQELAFHSRAWLEASIKVVVLKEVVRQHGDNVLLRIINDVRVGKTDTLHLLDSRIDAKFNDEIEPVNIFCRNVDVSAFNKERLSKLPGQSKTYYARDSGSPHHTEAFNRNCPAPEVLEIKIGAQVMCLANLNLDQGICNGAIGVVKSFGPSGVTVKFTNTSMLIDQHEWSIKEQEVGIDGKMKYKVVATRSQLPLKVCWAVTVHKVMGSTLDRAILNVADAFTTGQLYVALSRVRDLQSLSIVGGIPHSAIKVNRECIDFYEEAERTLG